MTTLRESLLPAGTPRVAPHEGSLRRFDTAHDTGVTVPLLILGTRTLAVEICDWVEDIPGVRVVGFVENMDRSHCEQPLEDRPVFWIDELPDRAPGCYAIAGLATTHRRIFVEQAAERGVRFTTVVHPMARVSKKARLGEGCLAAPAVLVGAHAEIGRHVLMNRAAMVGHHTRIGDFVTLQPRVNVAGCCSIGEGTYVGMGALILDHLKIGAHSVIGAGAVVTRDVPDHVQVTGVPARIVKENIDGK